jgi:hypothetical protein
MLYAPLVRYIPAGMRLPRQLENQIKIFGENSIAYFVPVPKFSNIKNM